ncbi:MAG TPA: hypothetical protein VFV19_03010 [Candidatus Polarisedimenticolaceae bacterium]|nr:hypothetical protein [Candidatus Polarisedimenticolaceae bacterium]
MTKPRNVATSGTSSPQVSTGETATSSKRPPVTPTTDPAKPRRGGAPKGNVNAARDPEFTLRMREARRLAKRGEGERLKKHVAEALRVILEAGIAASPIGERLARRLARAEHEIETMAKIVDRTGRVRRDGSLTPTYERLVSLEKEDRAEVRQLIDRLAELKAQAAPHAAETLYVVQLSDGTDLYNTLASQDASGSPATGADVEAVEGEERATAGNGESEAQS